MSEPTSTLTFRDLVIEVARHLGYANYGGGDEAPQVPQHAGDLEEAKRMVNHGIRMFFANGPAPYGWRFAKPVADIPVWGTVGAEAGKTVVSSGYDPGTNRTTLTANQDSFYSTMEYRTIEVTGDASYTIRRYLSPTQVEVEGDASSVGVAGATFRIESTGNFTLPRDFSGQYVGDITYVASTNQGVDMSWVAESVIRRLREDVTDETGDPYYAAIRPMNVGLDARRWELMLYPRPDEVETVEFQYVRHFDKLVELDETPPVPFVHDETIKAAVLAYAEKDVDGQPGVNWNYYQQMCLPNSYRMDAMSAPKRLGQMYNPSDSLSPADAIKAFRGFWYQRPNVNVN